MDAREERLARNEALFRDVNEHVRAIAVMHGEDAHVYQFYCECSNADCTFQVDVTLAEYEGIRTFPNRFLVAPDHWLPEVESIVMRNQAWWAVEKHGEAAELVEELDPRSD